MNNLQIQEVINRFSKPANIAFAVLVLIMIGVLDYVTGYEISFSIFYLIPITYLVWTTNKTYGIYLAVAASVIWFMADRLSGNQNSTSFVSYWNAFVRLTFFIIGVFLISLLKKSNIELENKVKERTADLTSEILERGKAEAELKATTEKLRLLTTRIQAIKEEESKVIAREIHDELGQALTAIKIDTAWLMKRYSNDSAIVEGLINISNTVDDTIKTVRKIATRLRPRLLDQLGLVPAIEWQIKEYQKKTGVKYDFVKPEEEFPLNGGVATTLFRIFQEALTNISRHANADRICVRLFISPPGVLNMLIRDNGVGLPDDYMKKNYSLGIVGMVERTKTIGGHFSIKSAAEGGTELVVKAPLKGDTEEQI